jgi:O-antigen/teichoic acid export membrane protein
MGAEGYGLVGFYAMLQSWMILFDFGLSAAVARQLSRYKAGVRSDAAGLLKVAETHYAAIGLIITGVFFLSSAPVARGWLGASTLPPSQITLSLQLMGLLIASRSMANLYQASLVGLERQNTLNSIVLLSTASRALISIILLTFVSKTPILFFTINLTITTVEVIVSRAITTREISITEKLRDVEWKHLLRDLRFAGGVAISATIATTINQIDKIVLSHRLSLSEYGFFSLVTTICAGVSLLIPPIVQLIQPRLASLVAQDRRAELFQLYRLSGNLMLALSAAVAGTIAAQPELVLFAWTGDPLIAVRWAPVLTLYALGTGIAGYLFVPFLLQYAHGYIRLHLIGTLLFGIFWIPAAIFAANAYGALGTGAVWLSGNALFVLIWVPFVHRRLLSREERKLVGWNTLVRVGLLASLLISSRTLVTMGTDRILALAMLAMVAAAVAAAGVLSSSQLRNYFIAVLRRPKARPMAAP